MPIIKMSIYKGKTTEEKKNICVAIQAAVKEVLLLNHDNFTHRIYEFSKENMIIPEGRSDNYMILELDMFPGKSKEQKRNIFPLILENLSKYEISKDDLIIIYREPLTENWYIRGQTAEEMLRLDE